MTLHWPALHEQLDCGFAQTPPVVGAAETPALAALYDTGEFRSTISMARHRFGGGEYKYFDRPLPEPVARLRETLYPPLAAAGPAQAVNSAAYALSAGWPPRCA